MSDWRSEVGKPPAHRVDGKADASVFDCSTVSKVAGASVAVLAVSFLAMLFFVPRQPCPTSGPVFPVLDSRHPLSEPKRTLESGEITLSYRIAVLTDLDLDSKSEKEKHTWRSFLRKGTLHVSKNPWRTFVHWDEEQHELKSTLAQGGRGMEMSDLAVFDGHLLAIDDRTGVLYRINGTKAVPWILLADGDGTEAKGFKGEWLAVKGDKLYVGGLGKEWTTIHGEFINYNPMWIKTVTHYGYVEHVDWHQQYIDLRAAAGIHYPGYMIHESGRWSRILKRWVFLPRRASTEVYTEEADERRATNIMLIATEDFKYVTVKRVGELHPTKGVSAFQFVPGTDDSIIVALKSEEDKGTIASYILAFDIDGNIVMPETKLEGSYKYEGIEFI